MNIRDRVIDQKKVPASSLRPSPLNWRTHPKEQRDALRGVLAEIGIAGAALTRKLDDGTLELIDGHLRTEELGDQLIPVIVTDLTAQEARNLLAVYDPIGAMAGTDTDKLDALLKEVTFDSPALLQMMEEIAEANGIGEEIVPGAGGDEFDATPEASGPTRTAVGDLWLIGGKHRLLVGDNTIAENVEGLMGGKRVGLCFTSPPSGQQRDYGEAAKEKVQDWHALMLGTFANLPMTDDGQVLVNLGLIHRDGEWIPYWDGWIEWMRSQGWRRFGWYVWDQGAGLMGNWNGRLGPSHEFVFHFNRESVQPDKFVATKQASRKGKKEGAPGQRAKDGTVKEMYSIDKCGQATKIPDSVIRISRNATIDMARNNHPATYPIQFPAFGMNCWPGLAYEPFSGSGTTIIAAEQLNRKCYAMEISPQYCDVAVQRWEKLTGQEAKRSTDG